MDDPTAFLRARLDDDERVARAVTPDDWGDTDDANRYEWDDLPDTAHAHTKRHDPARVLAEVDAKRRIIELLHREFLDDGEETWGDILYVEKFLKLLALPYAGHPDYREEWRP